MSETLEYKGYEPLRNKVNTVLSFLIYHPPLNVDDKTRDFPTVHLPDVVFHEANFPRWDAWREEIHSQDGQWKLRSQRIREIEQSIHILRSSRRMSEIDEDEYYAKKEILEAELESLRKKMN